MDTGVEEEGRMRMMAGEDGEWFSMDLIIEKKGGE